jgi:hypothetical protein
MGSAVWALVLSVATAASPPGAPEETPGVAPSVRTPDPFDASAAAQPEAVPTDAEDRSPAPHEASAVTAPPALPPGFPETVDLDDESTWSDLTVEQKDELRAIRASARAREAEGGHTEAPPPVASGLEDDEVRELLNARAAERQDKAGRGGKRRVADWAYPRLVGFGLTLGAGAVMGGAAPAIAMLGKPKVGIAMGVVGGLAIAIGLPGVIATALIRDAQLKLGSARLGLGAAGPWVRF